MKKLVSVIIPCYNDGNYIEEAIKSINNQEYKNIEIIVVDDGSDSKTKQVLNRIKQQNLKLITQKNAGPSVARNVAIKEAKGEYILTLDADDFFESSFISKAVLILNKEIKVGMVSCNGRIFSKKNKEESFIIPTGGGINEVFFSGKTFVIGNLLFRKQCWFDVNGYDDKMKYGYEDWEFNIAVVKKGWKVHIIKEVLFNYRNKKNSRNTLANTHHRFELKSYVYMKHKDICAHNINVFIKNIFVDFEKINNSNYKIRNSIDYRLGNFILRPFRYLKRLFK